MPSRYRVIPEDNTISYDCTCVQVMSLEMLCIVMIGLCPNGWVYTLFFNFSSRVAMGNISNPTVKFPIA